MLAAVKGYYDGNQIILNEDDRKNLNVGDEVVVTILGRINEQKVKIRAEKRKHFMESGLFLPVGGL